MSAIKTAKTKLIILGLVIIDVLFVIIGAVVTNVIMYGFGNLKDVFNYAYLTVLIAFVVFFFVMYDLYVSNTDTVFNSGISAGLGVLAASVCTMFVAWILNLSTRTVGAVFLEFIITEVFMVTWRTVAAEFIKRFGIKRSCLIIENMNNTSRLARKLKYALNDNKEAFYIMLDEDNEDEVRQLIENKIEQYDLIFISPWISQNITTKIMNKAFLLKKDVNVLADIDAISTMHGKIYQIEDTAVIEKKSLHMSRMQRFLKRTFDIVFSLVFSILSAPIALLCALAIKLDSPGPVLYKQERYTMDKKVFNVYKFRTMVQDAEKYGAQFATEDDPRITKSGKLLRATRLDELPQLYNILLGTMSVVGPRPERPIFADDFAKKVGNYDLRYCVKAGLTGYAQVYGKYNTRVSDKILMDMIYIVNYSFLLDIKLILLTVKTMFVKSATEGVDEERDVMLSTEEKEQKRRDYTIQKIGG